MFVNKNERPYSVFGFLSSVRGYEKRYGLS